MIGMICDAFDCTPSQAVAEPLGLCLAIIDQRAYARAFAAVRNARSAADLPADPLVAEVQENDMLARVEALTRLGQWIA